MKSKKEYITLNEAGLWIHAIRKSKRYTMVEICTGICSVSTLSRIEAGTKIADFLMTEALLDRMKLSTSEYEFILDGDDYRLYKQREEIKMLIQNKKSTQAAKKLKDYEKENNVFPLHRQFIFIQKALLEQTKKRSKKQEISEMFYNALSITAPDFQQKFDQRKNLSNTELFCISKIFSCIEDTHKREENLDELYAYFKWCHKTEGLFPLPYCIAMQYYAECLYENGKYKKCIQICSEALEELYKTSNLENRTALFQLRAKAHKKKGSETEEENKYSLRDFLTAYYLTEFYDEKAP